MNVVDQMTMRLLDEAGIGPGMRVLDIGCGIGAVSFMAAERVGSHGQVIGLDRDAGALQLARARQIELGLRNISFFEGGFDVAGIGDESCNATIGRRVLMYQSDPVTAVRSLVRVVKPGGRVLFHEHDLTTIEQVGAPWPLHERVRGWLRDMLLAEGADIHMGHHLHSVLSEAGLEVEEFRAEANLLTPSSRYPIASIVRAALPRLERFSIASKADIDIDTLDQRLIDERRCAQAICVWEFVFCATAQKPSRDRPARQLPSLEKRKRR